MDRKITVTGVNVVFLVFTALYLFFQFILAALVSLLGESFIDDSIYGILLINQYVIILIPVIVFTLFKRLDIRKAFRLNKLEPISALIILLLALPAQFVGTMLNSVVLYFMQFLGNIPSNSFPIPRDYGELATGIAIVALSPALCEELLHRGLMLGAYERRGSYRAIAITSVFFGIFHFDLTNLLGVIFLGALIAYYVVRTNSLFAGMLAHFLNNLIYEITAFLWPDNMPTGEYVTITLEELYGTIFYGAIGIVACTLLILLFRRATAKTAVIKQPISTVRNDVISVISHWPVVIVLILYALMSLLFFSAIA